MLSEFEVRKKRVRITLAVLLLIWPTGFILMKPYLFFPEVADLELVPAKLKFDRLVTTGAMGDRKTFIRIFEYPNLNLKVPGYENFYPKIKEEIKQGELIEVQLLAKDHKRLKKAISQEPIFMYSVKTPQSEIYGPEEGVKFAREEKRIQFIFGALVFAAGLFWLALAVRMRRPDISATN